MVQVKYSELNNPLFFQGVQKLTQTTACDGKTTFQIVKVAKVIQEELVTAKTAWTTLRRNFFEQKDMGEGKTADVLKEGKSPEEWETEEKALWPSLLPFHTSFPS